MYLPTAFLWKGEDSFKHGGIKINPEISIAGIMRKYQEHIQETNELVPFRAFLATALKTAITNAVYSTLTNSNYEGLDFIQDRDITAIRLDGGNDQDPVQFSWNESYQLILGFIDYKITTWLARLEAKNRADQFEKLFIQNFQ